jgi:AraC family transcriptional regulator of adaptative response / DNA-3-methyladenine glycosylase II
LRVPGCWDGFELAVRAILGQQIGVKGATTLAGRLAREFGSPAQNSFVTNAVLFPQPPAIYRGALEHIGLPEKRATAIREMALAVMRGEIALDGSLSHEELEERMKRIPGVGSWTAQYVAMRLGEPDAFPEGDLYLREHALVAEEWRPWRAYAAMYVWRGVSAAEVKEL